MNGINHNVALGAGARPERIPAMIHAMDAVDGGGKIVRLQTRTGIRSAWSWIDLNGVDTALRGYVSLLPFRRSAPAEILVGFERETDIPFRDLAYDQLCPIPGVVAQTAALVESIENDDIRRFITSALLDSRVCQRYWSYPASLSHHHAYEGGLALHSLEVATLVASSRALGNRDRDMGIAYALVHDYGKVLCYDNGRYTHHQRRGHEAVGRDLLDTHVRILGWGDEEMEAQFRELLGGRQRGRYPLAIGRIVRAFDQMSCETERLRRGSSVSGGEMAAR